MMRGSFTPDPFAVGLVIVGAVLLVFSSLRVAGLLAVLLAVAYWLLIAALRVLRR